MPGSPSWASLSVALTGTSEHVAHLVLLPSPLLGPAVWAPVADRLAARAWSVSVARLDGPVRSPDDVLRGFGAELPDRDAVLVAHSNAGLYVAALATVRTVTGVVFVDAGLPSKYPVTPTAPPAFRERLGGLADEDGLLPPWTRWWPAAEVAALFPDPVTRVGVEDEQRRLPLSYFDAEVPSPSGWQSVPSAYLAFGDTYAEERAEATRRGWPVQTLEGEHLHMLMDPDQVADALRLLLVRLGLG